MIRNSIGSANSSHKVAARNLLKFEIFSKTQTCRKKELPGRPLTDSYSQSSLEAQLSDSNESSSKLGFALILVRLSELFSDRYPFEILTELCQFDIADK
jgi:hypothetical protein